MRPFLSLTLILFCFCQASFGQDYVLLRDEFNKAQPMWDLRQGEYNFGEGRMNVQQNDLTARNLHVMEQFLSRSERYAISMTFVPEYVKGNASFGIMWGGNEDLSRYFIFEVNAMGFARVVEIRDGNLRVLKPWQKNRKIKGLEEEHTLTLRKEGRGAYFLVNDKELFRLDFPKVHGFFQGMSFYGSCQLAVDAFMIEHPPIRFLQLGGTWPEAVRLHLDSTINTPYLNETHPHFHPRRMQFYFSRQEDIYETHMSDSGWTAGAPLPYGFNDDEPNRVIGFIDQGRRMLMGGALSSRKIVANRVLSISDWEEEHWSNPKPFPIPSLGITQEEASDWYLSKDGKVLLFSAELPGGYGDQDIYLSFMDGEEWSKPINLGPSVNTFGKEYSPYLADDMKTLIFGSNGRAGFGKGDLYQTIRQSNTWTKWSLAYNLGPGINTPRWDRDFYPHPRELRTYFVASQDSNRGDYDLFRIKIPIDLEAQPLLKVFGDVYLEDSDERVEAEVQAWQLGELLNNQGEVETQQGRYGMLLPLGRAYQLYALKLGYYPVIDTLDARAFTTYREIRRNLYLKKLEVGVAVTLQQLFFERGKAELLSESYPELNRLLLLMQSRPQLRIEIHGHTDNIGEPAQLQFLSEQRAQRVRQYLINNRIAPGRIVARGFGPDRPIAPNENPITRALNRRVEFVIQ